VGAGTLGSVQIRLLGGFAVSIGGTVADERWRLRKAKTLVKLLALAPGHRMHRDAILDILWPDQDVSAATNNLHQALHAARRALGGQHVLLRDEAVVLEGATVDVDIFEELAAKARASGSVDDLRDAAAAWGGELLPEDAYANWAEVHRDRLADAHMGVVTQLASALVDAGAADDAVATIEPLALARPADEVVQRTFLTALAASGRRFDAVSAYEKLREELDAEYAAEPEPQTKAVYRQLLGTTAPSTDVPHNLPLPTSSFIGRQRELTELTSLLQRTRLLTLTGPGGAGKTRLAIELARRRLTSGDYPDGAWFIDLAAIQDGEQVPSAIAAALRIALSTRDAPVTSLTAQLKDEQLLLVLDNCEHLLEACVEMAEQLLAHCAGLTLLTTSREPLGLPGEVTFRVPSLELPSPDSVKVEELERLEAVQLFVERAQEVAPGFCINETTASAVAHICFRLDGIPLALELAAARLAHLTAPQLAERLGDAMRLLASHGRGRLDRQQTLAATLDWSHELLDDAERVVFRRLAIFAGGFDLEAAEFVCNVEDVFGVLSRLVDKSLVHTDMTGDRARYRLLEVIRQYAEVRLGAAGDLAECRRRHVQWYAEEAAKRDPERGDPVVKEPSQWFDLEHDNIRTAMSAALSEDPARALQIAVSTWRFWLSRGLLVDGARWISQALDACPTVSAMRVRAVFAHGVLQLRQGLSRPLPALGADMVAAALQLDDPILLLLTRQQNAIFNFMAAEWDAATTELETALELARELPAHAASLQNFAAIHAMTRGDVDEARSRWEAALSSLETVSDDTAPFFTAIFPAVTVDDRGAIPLAYGEETLLFGRRVGAAQARAHVRVGTALAERLADHVNDSLRILDEVADDFDRIGDSLGLAHALSQRGHTLRWAGRYDDARDCLQASERLRRQLRDHRGIALSLAGRAVVEAHAGNASEARRIAAEAVAMMRATGDEPGANMALQDACIVEIVLGDWEAAASAGAWALEVSDVPGAHRSIGWQQLTRAHVLCRLGDADGAAAAAQQAQLTFADIGDRRGLAALQRGCKDGAFTLPDDSTS
jgi:predicted ATPase/DNA-binding SARP family transcriptional activator